MRIPLFFRLYGSFALIIVVSAAVVWLIAAGRVEREARDTLRQVLQTRTSLLDVAGLDPTAAERDLVRRLGSESDTRFTLVRLDGTVTADSEKTAADMENHGQRPEIREAIETARPASSIRYSRTLGHEMMYLAWPVKREGRVTGVIRAAVPLTLVEERQRDARTSIALGAASAMILALVLGFLLTRRFTRPLAAMTAAAESIAEGRYQPRLEVSSSDEMGQLARALERMSGQLEERMHKLARERNQLQAVLGSMLEGVVAVDREERVLHMNGVAGRLLGTSAPAAKGRRFWELVRIQEIGDTLTEVLKEAAERSREVRLPGSLRERIIEVHASPLKAPSGEVAGAVMVLFDVTELRHLELVRREFVANVSHELKTPLTAIRGFIETILDDPGSEAEIREKFLRRALAQSVRISALVNDLLVLSQVESEEQALDRHPLDLRDPVAGAARRLTSDMTGRTIAFETTLPEERVPLMGDEEALRQAVDNLLGNALKYTADEGEIRLSLEVDGDFAVISVADDGIGIDAVDQARIFERFYRVDKARSRALGGTGLGLSIVKHIAEAHGGSVDVTSAPGKGSTFRIRLPLHRG